MKSGFFKLSHYRLEVGELRQIPQAIFHRLAIQHSGDIMRRQRGSFPASCEREFNENGVNDAPGNFAESVAVEKEERSGAMTLEEEIQGIAERQLSGTVLFPSLADSLISFRVMSVESLSSIDCNPL